MGGVFQPSTAAQYILICMTISVYQRKAICNNMDRNNFFSDEQPYSLSKLFGTNDYHNKMMCRVKEPRR